jgi:hypothetical protein
MSFFSKILSKLGIGSAEAAPAGSVATAGVPQPEIPAAPQAEMPVAAPAPAPTPVPVVDVMKKLDALAHANPQKLNWKTSIVDLLKLLDIDNSYPARKELATELGCPAELMGDSAKMNMWLHKTVLRKIAENGGNVPQELLD